MIVDSSIVFGHHLVFSNIEKYAVVADGIIRFPVIGLIVVFAGGLLQQPWSCNYQAFRHSDEHIHTFIRFIAGVVFAGEV
jgi:hypothetical protein